MCSQNRSAFVVTSPHVTHLCHTASIHSRMVALRERATAVIHFVLPELLARWHRYSPRVMKPCCCVHSVHR